MPAATRLYQPTHFYRFIASLWLSSVRPLLNCLSLQHGSDQEDEVSPRFAFLLLMKPSISMRIVRLISTPTLMLICHPGNFCWAEQAIIFIFLDWNGKEEGLIFSYLQLTREKEGCYPPPLLQRKSPLYLSFWLIQVVISPQQPIIHQSLSSALPA